MKQDKDNTIICFACFTENPITAHNCINCNTPFDNDSITDMKRYDAVVDDSNLKLSIKKAKRDILSIFLISSPLFIIFISALLSLIFGWCDDAGELGVVFVLLSPFIIGYTIKMIKAYKQYIKLKRITIKTF